jgi:Secretion system C-terminal sorting domain
MMGGGIINDKIIVAGGWNGINALPDVYIGTINLTDPTQISWAAAGKYPADTINGITRMASFPVVTGNGKGAGIAFAGGAISGATITTNSYLWNYCTNQWTVIPSIPVGRSNFKMASKYIPSTFYGNEVYTVAGYDGLGGVGNFEKLTFGTIAGTCYQALPVELISFTAGVTGNNVSLSWSTSTETNNRGFEVERKSEGGNYKSLGFINGKGTTTEKQSYMIVDYDVPAGKYYYRLKQIDLNGTMNYSKEIFADISVPAEFTLSQNYPNPFNPTTSIKFGLKFDSKVTLRIFNVLGQQISTLVNTDLKAGYYNEEFNASYLPSGVYLYTIEAAGHNGQNFTATKKLVLLK